MLSFLDERFQGGAPDDEGRAAPFTVGAIGRVSVTLKGEVVEGVPLLMRYLRRQPQATECAVCRDEPARVAAAAHMEGMDDHGWVAGLLYFPSKDMLRTCKHELNKCKGCMAKHLHSQVERMGWAACGRLSCPTCQRLLQVDEIPLLASAETFARCVSSFPRSRPSRSPPLFT